MGFIITENRSERLNGLRSLLSLVVYPVQIIASLPSRLAIEAASNVNSYKNLQLELKNLKHELFITQGKLLKFESLEQENIRLRSLLDNSFNLGEQVLVAELLSVNLVPYEHTVLVNKGSRFGVHEKQPVLDAQGIVGQVVRSTMLTSEIMLITDPGHAIPVQINRNGLRTIAVGSGQLNRLNLPFLPNNADIVPGDLLITSGLGGRFPHGYPVAIVDTFTAKPGQPFASIFATPKAKLDQLREVLIVWSDPEPMPLTESPDPEKPANNDHQ